ncbi:MAG: hypothetical protein ACFFKA_13695 [Candidatus Thorarchaeota archaeon]
MSKEEEEKKLIKYKGKVNSVNYLANPSFNEPYMILNTQILEEELINSQKRITEDNFDSNKKLFLDNSLGDAKIIHKKKRIGD